MKITRIAEQVKQKGRYSIFVEGRYAFSLSETALLESGLASGRELAEAELGEWKRQSADDKAYAGALRYAAMRSRSVGEMQIYLKRKAVPPALAEYILNKLSSVGLLNDADFARMFVDNRRLLRPTSKLKLQQELRAKRVSDELIGRAIAEGIPDERAALRTIIAKKRNLTRYKADRVKLMQYLIRQGFSYDDVKAEMRLSDDTM